MGQNPVRWDLLDHTHTIYLCPKKVSFVNMAKVCLLFGLMLFSAVFAKHDEWYCKVDSDKYQICRKCKTLEEDCDYEAPDDCKCENLKFANTDCKLDFLKDFLTSTYLLHYI